MSNHTPGDWEMVVAPAFGPEDYEGITIESPSTGTIICDMAGGLPLIETLANAQLIEKAPKMLDILKRIINTDAVRNDDEQLHDEALTLIFEVEKVDV
jgi:hypothetical protein